MRIWGVPIATRGRRSTAHYVYSWRCDRCGPVTVLGRLSSLGKGSSGHTRSWDGRRGGRPAVVDGEQASKAASRGSVRLSEEKASGRVGVRACG